MSDRTACVIVNYNMPERADALAEFINDKVNSPCDVILVDNGSDISPVAKNTTLRLVKNMQTTFGWLAGLKYADLLAEVSGHAYFAYWFLITSTEFVGRDDPLTPMINILEEVPAIVGIHPTLTEDSTTSWGHMKYRGDTHNNLKIRGTFMIDNIASLYRADWFNSIGRFDAKLKYAWGIDLETCWKARRDGRIIVICESVRVKKVTNIGYNMQRMNMTAQEREYRAGQNMAEVLETRYGPDWWKRMNNEYVEEYMR